MDMYYGQYGDTEFVIYNLFDADTDAYNSRETSWALRSTLRKFESEYLIFHHTT